MKDCVTREQVFSFSPPDARDCQTVKSCHQICVPNQLWRCRTNHDFTCQLFVCWRCCHQSLPPSLGRRGLPTWYRKRMFPPSTAIRGVGHLLHQDTRGMKPVSQWAGGLTKFRAWIGLQMNLSVPSRPGRWDTEHECSWWHWLPPQRLTNQKNPQCGCQRSPWEPTEVRPKEHKEEPETAGVHACKYTLTFIHAYAHTRSPTFIYPHMLINTSSCTYPHVCSYTYTYAHIHSHTQAHMSTPAHVPMITCSHTCTHRSTPVCPHTHTLTHARMITILHMLTCTHSHTYKHTPEPHHFVQGQLGTWLLDEITKQLGPDDARTSEVYPCWFHYFLVSYGADLTQPLCKDWGIGGAGGWRSHMCQRVPTNLFCNSTVTTVP